MRFLFAALVLFLNVPSVIAAVPPWQSGPHRSVILLNSYHRGYEWSDAIADGVEDVIGGDRSVELSIEYLDLIRNVSSEYRVILTSLLEEKYGRNVPDCIIVSDNMGLDFLLERRERLFPGVPIVFCGIDRYDTAGYGTAERMTGVLEEVDIGSTLDAVRALQPHPGRIVVVHDDTPAGRELGSVARETLAGRPPGPPWTVWGGLGFAVLSDSLETLSPHDAVLLLPMTHDTDGEVLDLERSVHFVTHYSPAPVYSLWDFTVGHGVAGGVVVSGFSQGCEAGMISTRILSGDLSLFSQSVRKSPNIPMFDFTVLERHGLDPGRLPPESILINRPDTFYERYRRILLTGAVLIIIQSALIALLLINMYRRRTAEQELAASESKYLCLVENTNDIIYAVETAGTVTYVSPQVCRYGYLAGEVIGRSFSDFIAPEDRNDVLADFMHTMESGDEFVTRFRLIGAAGETHWIDENGGVQRDAEGVITGLIGVLRDITEHREMEEKLAASIEEKDILLREIHHRVKNNMQVITSLLNLQLERVREPERRDVLLETINRIMAMSVIHEVLYQSENFAMIDFSYCVRKIVNGLASMYGENRDIGTTLEVHDVFLPLDMAIPCGLIVNELVSNVYRHAFPGGRRGSLKVGLKRLDGGQAEIRVADDGIGMDHPVDPETADTLGLKIVHLLAVKQLEGSLAILHDNGTTARFVFPVPESNTPV